MEHFKGTKATTRGHGGNCFRCFHEVPGLKSSQSFMKYNLLLCRFFCYACKHLFEIGPMSPWCLSTSHKSFTFVTDFCVDCASWRLCKHGLFWQCNWSALFLSLSINNSWSSEVWVCTWLAWPFDPLHAWNFIFERARSVSFYKGHFHLKMGNLLKGHQGQDLGNRFLA